MEYYCVYAIVLHMSRASILLRAARQEANLTQAELARRAGMTQSVIARMESPTSNPTVSTLDDVLSACHRRLDLTASRHLADVDEDQIARQLALTAAQRIAHHDAAQRDIGKLARGARRVAR